MLTRMQEAEPKAGLVPFQRVMKPREGGKR
jgi:hypothetical protein